MEPANRTRKPHALRAESNQRVPTATRDVFQKQDDENHERWREGGREREMEREREQRTPLDAGFDLRVVLPEDD